MALAVESSWDGRYDDRLVALPDGRWASATDRALTRWDVDGPGDPVVVDEPRRGPLVWLPAVDQLAWGPALADGSGPEPSSLATAALPELAASAIRHYRVALGTFEPLGRKVVLALEHQPSRSTAAGSRTGPRTRLAVVDRVRGECTSMLGDDLGEPGCVAAGAGCVLVGLPGRVMVLPGGDPGTEVRLPGVAAARALAVDSAGIDPTGVAAAAFGDGTVATWALGATSVSPRPAHDGAVLALTWAPGGRALATAGADGMVRCWTTGGKPSAETDLGDAVTAVAWLADGRLVAKVGSSAGRIVVLAAP
ncbi:MAG: hypothetical protein AVDCRST_MAG50-1151 [uncultured Acidimicrobiales bacterium]|uniref:Uncharacterized protein n=1 Tax=uncultured Acidimicrobiales bacterium TaxID=310071 RepID=A0A6J4HQB5_9ACTN|nr:MAG: hypothetical protein AVDCRST_MAG50-1151 [uncultured Acidimicrobiales bacterium]